MGFFNIRKHSLLFVLSLVFVLTSACTCGEEPGYTIPSSTVYFVNNSNDTLFVRYWEYGDTDRIITPSFVFYTLGIESLIKISPNSRCPFPASNYGAAEILQDKRVSHQFIVFKKSTLDKYSKRQIVEQNIFDKRLIFTYSDLERMNFTIEYDD